MTVFKTVLTVSLSLGNVLAARRTGVFKVGPTQDPDFVRQEGICKYRTENDITYSIFYDIELKRGDGWKIVKMKNE